MLGRLIFCGLAGLAIPCSAEICLKLPVVSDVELRQPYAINWQQDPAAVAYCEISLNSPELCVEPRLTSGCRSAIVELAGFGVVRVLAWQVDEGIVFGQVEIAAQDCEGAPTKEIRWLPLRGQTCVFRPKFSWPEIAE